MVELVDEAHERPARSASRPPVRCCHVVPDGRPVPGTFADADELLAFGDVLGRATARASSRARARLGERDGTSTAEDPGRGGLDGGGVAAGPAGRSASGWSTPTAGPTCTARSSSSPRTRTPTGASAPPPDDRSWHRHPLRPGQPDPVRPDALRGGSCASCRRPTGWPRSAIRSRRARHSSPRAPRTLMLGPDDDLRPSPRPPATTAGRRTPSPPMRPGAGVSARSRPSSICASRPTARQPQLPDPQPELRRRRGDARRPDWSPSGWPTPAPTSARSWTPASRRSCSRYWVRERQRWTLEEAIRRLTSDTADLFGITDRGVLRAGAFADVNVIDLDNLRLPQPEFVLDFPNGAGALHPGRQRLRLHDRQRRGVHGPRRAHRRPRRPFVLPQA